MADRGEEKMKDTENVTFDVALVCDPAEAVLAEAVRRQLNAAGLACETYPSDVTPGEDFRETVVQMANSSRSLVLLMSRAAATSQVMAVFAGAAWAAELPIFILRNNVRPSDYFSFYRQFPSFVLWSVVSRLVEALY